MKKYLISALFLLLIPVASCKGPEGRVLSRPHLVLIILDTVRRDALGSYGYKAEVSPAFDSFAEKGVRFEDVRSNSPWTLPSHSSMFTGLLPSEHGATNESLVLAKKNRTVAERLKKKGYQTAGFSTNPWLTLFTGVNQGFEQYYWIHWPMADSSAGKKGGQKLIMRLRHWNREKRKPDKPAFLFFNLMEAHAPYFPPEHYRKAVAGSRGGNITAESSSLLPILSHNLKVKKIPEGDIALFRLLYQGAISYQDFLLARLLKVLEYIVPGAFIIITSDHGEAFNEHGLISHEFSLYEELLRVPMAANFGNCFKPGTRTDAPLMLTDVHDMLLRASKSDPACPERINPLDLVPDARNRDRVRKSEYFRPALLHRIFKKIHPSRMKNIDLRLQAITRGNKKLLADSAGRLRLFNLEKDPGEKKDLSSSNQDEVESLSSQLGRWLRGQGHGKSPGKIDHIGQEVKEQLKALGYAL